LILDEGCVAANVSIDEAGGIGPGRGCCGVGPLSSPGVGKAYGWAGVLLIEGRRGNKIPADGAGLVEAAVITALSCVGGRIKGAEGESSFDQLSLSFGAPMRLVARRCSS